MAFMKKSLMALLSATSLFALSSASAQGVSLARYIPSDALVTLELGDFAASQKQLGAIAKELSTIDIFALTGEKWPAEMQKAGLSSPIDFISRGGIISLHWPAKMAQPQILLVAQPKAGLDKLVTRVFADLSKSTKTKKVTTLKEGAYRFYQEGTDTFYGYQNGIAYLSNDATALRGFLRRLGGSKEPNLLQDKVYSNTMNSVGQGVLRTYINFAGAATTVKSFVDLSSGSSSSKEGQLLANSLKTLGQFGGSLSVHATGMTSTSILFPNPNGGDAALYALLVPKMQKFTLPAMLPASASAVSEANFDLNAIYKYLNTWIGRLGGEGSPSINDLVLQSAGIDLNKNLLSWVGTEFAVVNFSTKKVADPTNPLSSLEGSAAYIKVKDESAAKKGIDLMIDALLSQSGPMESGDVGATKRGTTSVEGTDVVSVTSEGKGIWYAVKNGALILTASVADMKSALASGPRLASDSGYTSALKRVPSAISAFSYSPKPVIQSRLTIRQQLETGLLGLSGGTSVQRNQLVTVLTNVIDSLQKRSGIALGYTTFQNGKIISKSTQEVNWK